MRRRGWLSSVVPFPLPYVLGYDVACTVVGLGPRVAAPALGSAVIRPARRRRRGRVHGRPGEPARRGSDVHPARRGGSAARQLGADEVVDYTAGPIAFGEPADVVLNFAAIDPGRLAALAAHVRPGGVLVSAATGVSHLAGVPRDTG
jgi:NADPH:quinone reductase-like Zn-dependent oxidoreductase